MVICHARIRLLPGTRAAFLAAALPCLAATRQEEGCRSYTIFEDMTDADSIIFVEEWRDEAAVSDHMLAAHTQALLAAAPAFLAAPPSILMHRVTATTPLA